MAVTIGKKFIEKYVLKKLAERSGKRTGITTIQNVKDPQVQFNIEEVRKTIESLGMSPNDVKSVAEIEKIMNIRKAVSDQTLKNKFKNLGLDKGVDDLAKKPPFQGFTPTIVGKPAKGNINYPEIEKKFGFPLRGNESLSELAKIERIGRDQYYNMLASRAMNIRRRMSKVDAEGGTEIGYQEFNKLQEELDGLNDFITRVQKEIPEDMASGGLARVGMFVGGSVWKKFIEKLFIKSSNDIRLGKGKWAGLTQPQWIKQHDDLTKMLKKWEMSGKKGLPEGAEQYLGMNDLQIAKAIKDAEKKVKDVEFPTLERMPKSSPKDDLSQEIRKGVEDVMKDTSEAGLKRSIETDNLKLEFPGISDEMIDNILTDTNPQRIAEVKQTMREALEMGKKGMSPDEIIKMFKDTTRTKQASGGIAGQLHMNRPGYESGLKVYPKIDITQTGSTPAEGIDVSERDITVGGTGIYQGPNWFAGAEGLTGNVKVDVTAGGETLFKDTMSKDNALNYIIGLGEAEGDKVQIKADENFDNVRIVLKKKFNQGGLANILGV